MSSSHENIAPRPNVGPENKESQKEALEIARRLCTEYHAKLDQTKYFDSNAIKEAAKLLPHFRKINKNLLPKPVELVVKHRLAYLEFIASFEQSPAIGAFLDSIKIDEIGTTPPEILYESLKNEDKFKALGPVDLRQASSSVAIGIQALYPVNSASNWGKNAEREIKPPGLQGTDNRVDDEQAAKYLQLIFMKIGEFVGYAQRQMYKKS